MRLRRAIVCALGLAAVLAAGFVLANGNPFEQESSAPSFAVAAPSTKAGAEFLVLQSAARMLSPAVRSKFVDSITGLLMTNDFAQCYPSTTTNGWWVCELNSLVHPRPLAWFSVSYTGIIREKGEQPLGYGWVPTPTAALPAKTRDDLF